MYICNQCKQPARIAEYKVGSYIDDAWGMSKRFDNVVELTACCNAEFQEVRIEESVQTLREKWNMLVASIEEIEKAITKIEEEIYGEK